MRVVAGELKGRKILAPEGKTTRPTTDMARSAAFEIIDADPTLKKHKVLRDEIELLLTPEEEEFLFKS